MGQYKLSYLKMTENDIFKFKLFCNILLKSPSHHSKSKLHTGYAVYHEMYMILGGN